MTYCVGFLLEAGLVFASDSRTNAGVDYISTYSKMHVFQPSPDRLFILMAAGNLATTQAVLNRIRRDIEDRSAGRPPIGALPRTIADDRPVGSHAAASLAPAPVQAAAAPPLSATSVTDAAGVDLMTARHLFEAVEYVGRQSVAVQEAVAPSLRQAGASSEATFILGGQIAGQRHGLYLIYPQGNAIMATAETPFLQIGESKYGKPPLDYIGHPGLSLEDAARLCLVSQILTRRSNLTVGPPFEIAMVPRDALRVSRRLKLVKGAPELNRTMEVWTRSMQEGLQRMPRFAWEEDPL